MERTLKFTTRNLRLPEEEEEMQTLLIIQGTIMTLVALIVDG